jgi:t-SNARE complex subunit (syntaxin)
LLPPLTPHAARTRREIKIVDKDLKDSEIDKIIESGKAQDVIKEALISDNLKNVVQVIEERHLDILKLEHQVRTPPPCCIDPAEIRGGCPR